MTLYKSFLKPLFDRCCGFIMLAAASPVLAVLALLVKLSSPGPCFFKQKRMGLAGTPFMLYKFRSMRVDTEAEKKGFEPGGKSRITWIGAILRKTKLDELPQLINVVKGEMSLVGPRPEVEVYVNLYPERWRNVLAVRPGITDPASIKFRNEEELLAEADDPETYYRETILPHKLDLYEDYVGNISFMKDLVVMIQTAVAVIAK